MTSVTALVKENAALARRVDRVRDDAETRSDYGTIIATAVGARVGVKLLTTFVPSLAAMQPVIEIGGAALAAKKAFELGEDAPMMLGAAIGLGIGAADRFADTALATINKFKSK